MAGSRILIVGAGSMGRRRLRDCTALRPGQVDLYEPDPQRCQTIAAQFEVTGHVDLDAALAQQPEVLVISTPPALHDRYVRLALERGMHFFAEVPLAFNLDVLEEVAQRAPDHPGVIGVSSTIRLYPPFRLIYDLLQEGAIGRVLYLRYNLGNYLPDWHPHEDYRQFYAGHDPRAGGSGMDMILHEMMAIQWWAGPVESAAVHFAKVSDLEIPGPDVHDVLLRFESGARGFFHHDIIERGTRGRHVHIVGDAGTIEWGQHESSIRLYRAGTGSEEMLPFDRAADYPRAVAASDEVRRIIARTQSRSGAVPGGVQGAFTYESCYLREMRHFLDAADGRHPYTLASVEEEVRNVKLFHKILDASHEHDTVAAAR